MAYAELTDLIAAFGEEEILALADRDDDGVADATVIASAQSRSQSLIDGYLGGRYGVPVVSPYPVVLVGVDADIQRYLLYDNESPDRVKEAYQFAISWLRDVAAGRVVLTLPAPATGTAIGSAGFLAVERLWSPDTLVTF